MSPRRRFLVRMERACRNLDCYLRGLAGTATFPVRYPGLWLFCKHTRLVFFLHYTCERPDLAFRVAAAWQSKFHYFDDHFRKHGRPFGVLA